MAAVFTPNIWEGLDDSTTCDDWTLTLWQKLIEKNQNTWLRIQSHALIHPTWPNYKTKLKQILWNYMSSFMEMDWFGMVWVFNAEWAEI